MRTQRFTDSEIESILAEDGSDAAVAARHRVPLTTLLDWRIDRGQYTEGDAFVILKIAEDSRRERRRKNLLMIPQSLGLLAAVYGVLILIGSVGRVWTVLTLGFGPIAEEWNADPDTRLSYILSALAFLAFLLFVAAGLRASAGWLGVASLATVVIGSYSLGHAIDSGVDVGAALGLLGLLVIASVALYRTGRLRVLRWQEEVIRSLREREP